MVTGVPGAGVLPLGCPRTGFRERGYWFQGVQEQGRRFQGVQEHGCWFQEHGVQEVQELQEHGIPGVPKQGHKLRQRWVRIQGFLGVLELGVRRQGAWEPGFCPSRVQEQGL